MNKELGNKPIKKGTKDEEDVREAAIRKAFEQYQEEHSDRMKMGEEGESEMMEEEGEYEWEEGDGESVEYSGSQVVVSGKSDSEEPPKLIPIEAAAAAALAKKQTKQASKKEVAADAESSSELSGTSESELNSSMDTEELEQREFELAGDTKTNEHGFVYEADLNTYRMNKKERTELREKAKETEEKKKFLSSAEKRRNKKNNGSTNIEKLKHKPMNMLLPKRIDNRNEKRDGKMVVKRKSAMKQLGHFKKN